MSHSYFITGTDTDVGKTWIALALLHALHRQGYRTLAMKPVACGCVITDGIYQNDDAVKLQRQASIAVPYREINPYALPAPVAPHLAAARIGLQIDVDHIRQLYEQQKDKADYVVMEGVGGWMVPLNADSTTADMVKAMDIPVILVVGIRLGCLNHALLTHAAIQQQGIRLVAWVANCIDKDCLEVINNIDTLRERFNVPLLGIVPYLEKCEIQTIADRLDINELIKD
jgi:dethiobiotin synthetase